MYDISPKKMFEPRLNKIAAPILARNTNGIIQLSRNTIIAITAKTTAIAT